MGHCASHCASLQRLDHEHIVKIEEYFINDGKCYIVMELLEGPELMDEVYSAGEGGRYTEADVKVIMAKLLDAVAYMHLQVARQDRMHVWYFEYSQYGGTAAMRNGGDRPTETKR